MLIFYPFKNTGEKEELYGRKKIIGLQGSTKDYVPVPKITIQGQWLESLGFSIGDKLA